MSDQVLRPRLAFADSDTNSLERGIHGYFPLGCGRCLHSPRNGRCVHGAELAQLANRVADAEDGVGRPLPALVRASARVLVRTVTGQNSTPLTRSLYQQLLGSLHQAVRSLIRQGGRAAVRAFPVIVQRVGQNARRHGLSMQVLPQAVRQITRRVARDRGLLRRLLQRVANAAVMPDLSDLPDLPDLPDLSELSQLSGDAFELADWDAANRPGRSRVGPYRRVRGHHIHQAASYGRPGRPRRTNPNYRSAVAIAHGPGFTRQQHRRADAVQRNLNRAYHGRSVNQPQIGNVRIQATGTGTLPPTPNPYFEDTKAFYALRAAGVPAAQALSLVNQSAAQLTQSGTQPVRVPQ